MKSDHSGTHISKHMKLSFFLVSGLLLASCVPETETEEADAMAGAAPQVSSADACAMLSGALISAERIGLPSSGAYIKSTELISADAEGNTSGEFCIVLGAIKPVDYTAPDINFEVNLPSAWNQKTLQFGGGALNGTVISGLGFYAKQPESELRPLGKGYVTLGSDSGHQSSGGFDGSFYLNEEALLNFGHMQIKKTHDVALWIVEQRYGAKPEFSYFVGGSQGGHEGFDAVQRFPDDYDGVVAGYPAHNVVMLHLSALEYARALAANDGAGWLNEDEIRFFTGEVYARCDALDGLEDGIISNTQSCRAATQAFKLTTNNNPIRCVSGVDSSDSCLSDAQIEALNSIDEPYEVGFKIFRDDEGSSIFPKWTPFEGSTFMDGGSTNLGSTGPESALQRGPGEVTNGLAIAQDLAMNVMEDFDPLEHAARIIEVSSMMSANSVEIERFRDKGGKLIFYHGKVDDYIPVYSSIQYYERLLNHFGQSETDRFVRFYTVPGMGHRTGVFDARISTLDALEAWVEEGVAPGELLATDANAATLGRSRPVCIYPAWPRYEGAGDMNEAASFECVTQ